MTADPVRQAAEALLAIIDAYEEENGPWGTVVTDNAFAALRAALDAPPRGVTVEEVFQSITDARKTLPTNGAPDWHLATALLPLFERARLAGFAEGIEAAAGVADAVRAKWRVHYEKARARDDVAAMTHPFLAQIEAASP